MEKFEERKEKLEHLCRLRDRMKDLEKRLEDGAVSPEEYEVEAIITKAEVEVEMGRKSSPNLLLCRLEYCILESN